MFPKAFEECKWLCLFCWFRRSFVADVYSYHDGKLPRRHVDVFFLVRLLNVPIFNTVVLRMPAYNLNGFYCITFVAFMILNLYLFNNILLATVYTNYRKNLKEEVKLSIQLRREKLRNGFNFLKTRSPNYTEIFSVTFTTFERLIKQMYPNGSECKTKILFNLLDRDDANQLCNFLFFRLIVIIFEINPIMIIPLVIKEKIKTISG